MGRDPTSDLFVDNSDVSWRHCLLDIQASGLSILDLNSTNGTYLNGKLIQNAHLNHGDRIELGPCLFTVNREALNIP
jgi:pSer/pThr/pTyr-binding forkhead associated (FHA) protein